MLSTIRPDLRKRPVVFTRPEPWAMVAHLFDPATTSVVVVRSSDQEAFLQEARSIGPATAVFGIGGGAAMDHAKYAAMVTGLPLLLMPTILSLDAAFTRAIAVRQQGRVRHVGEVEPSQILLDLGLIQAAPRLLNLAGAGDILSITTALWDWREAARRLKEPYDEAVAARAAGLLERLFAAVATLREVSDSGLRLIADLYMEKVRLCDMVGTARGQKGSEHHLAYCLEYLTGASFVHGQLVSACVLLTGLHQGQDVRPVASFLRELGLDCSLDSMGVSREAMLRALVHVGRYVLEERQLLPGVFHFRPPTEADARSLLDEFEAMTL